MMLFPRCGKVLVIDDQVEEAVPLLNLLGNTFGKLSYAYIADVIIKHFTAYAFNFNTSPCQLNVFRLPVCRGSDC